MCPVVTHNPTASLLESGRLPAPVSPCDLLELPTAEFEACNVEELNEREAAELRALETSRRELGLETGWYYEDSEPTLGTSLPSSPDGRTYIP